MDLKICIWFIFLLAIGQARGYIKCIEMHQDTDTFQGKDCSLHGISADYFLRNGFYNDASADTIQNLRITTDLSDIPEGIEKRFSRVTVLDFAVSGLKNLQKKSLDRVPATVRELKMEYCKFTKLTEDMFTSVSGLRLLDMSYGIIDQIHDKAFAKLADLTTLDLHSNRIKTITKEMFDELPNLVFLDLSHNSLSVSLEPGIFRGCPRLEQLVLSHNQLTAVKAGFVSAMRLNELSLSSNRLTVFDVGSLIVDELNVDQNNLTELYIPPSPSILNAANNKIIRLTCGKHRSIRKLDLANNSISSMDCIGNATTLMSLDLTYNNIGELNSSTFAQLKELRELRIGHTNISNFVLGVLDQQARLEILDLSYNQLGDFPIKIIKHLKQLQQLYIDGNNVTKIPIDEISTNFKALHMLGIGENDLDCADLVKMFVTADLKLPECEIVSMSGNDIVMYSHDIRGIGCESQNASTAPELKSILESMKSIRDQIKLLQMRQLNESAILKEIKTIKEQMMASESKIFLHHTFLKSFLLVVLIALIGALIFCCYKIYVDYRVQSRAPDAVEMQGSNEYALFENPNFRHLQNPHAHES